MAIKKSGIQIDVDTKAGVAAARNLAKSIDTIANAAEKLSKISVDFSKVFKSSSRGMGLAEGVKKEVHDAEDLLTKYQRKLNGVAIAQERLFNRISRGISKDPRATHEEVYIGIKWAQERAAMGIKPRNPLYAVTKQIEDFEREISRQKKEIRQQFMRAGIQASSEQTYGLSLDPKFKNTAVARQWASIASKQARGVVTPETAAVMRSAAMAQYNDLEAIRQRVRDDKQQESNRRALNAQRTQTYNEQFKQEESNRRALSRQRMSIGAGQQAYLTDAQTRASIYADPRMAGMSRGAVGRVVGIARAGGTPDQINSLIALEKQADKAGKALFGAAAKPEEKFSKLKDLFPKMASGLQQVERVALRVLTAMGVFSTVMTMRGLIKDSIEFQSTMEQVRLGFAETLSISNRLIDAQTRKELPVSAQISASFMESENAMESIFENASKFGVPATQIAEAFAVTAGAARTGGMELKASVDIITKLMVLAQRVHVPMNVLARDVRDIFTGLNVQRTILGNILGLNQTMVRDAIRRGELEKVLEERLKILSGTLEANLYTLQGQRNAIVAIIQDIQRIAGAAFFEETKRILDSIRTTLDAIRHDPEAMMKLKQAAFDFAKSMEKAVSMALQMIPLIEKIASVWIGVKVGGLLGSAATGIGKAAGSVWEGMMSGGMGAGLGAMFESLSGRVIGMIGGGIIGAVALPAVIEAITWLFGKAIKDGASNELPKIIASMHQKSAESAMRARGESPALAAAGLNSPEKIRAARTRVQQARAMMSPENLAMVGISGGAPYIPDDIAALLDVPESEWSSHEHYIRRSTIEQAKSVKGQRPRYQKMASQNILDYVNRYLSAYYMARVGGMSLKDIGAVGIQLELPGQGKKVMNPVEFMTNVGGLFEQARSNPEMYNEDVLKVARDKMTGFNKDWAEIATHFGDLADLIKKGKDDAIAENLRVKRTLTEGAHKTFESALTEDSLGRYSAARREEARAEYLQEYNTKARELKEATYRPHMFEEDSKTLLAVTGGILGNINARYKAKLKEIEIDERSLYLGKVIVQNLERQDKAMERMTNAREAYLEAQQTDYEKQAKIADIYGISPEGKVAAAQPLAMSRVAAYSELRDRWTNLAQGQGATINKLRDDQSKLSDTSNEYWEIQRSIELIQVSQGRQLEKAWDYEKKRKQTLDEYYLKLLEVHNTTVNLGKAMSDSISGGLADSLYAAGDFWQNFSESIKSGMQSTFKEGFARAIKEKLGFDQVLEFNFLKFIPALGAKAGEATSNNMFGKLIGGAANAVGAIAGMLGFTPNIPASVQTAATAAGVPVSTASGSAGAGGGMGLVTSAMKMASGSGGVNMLSSLMGLGGASVFGNALAAQAFISGAGGTYTAALGSNAAFEAAMAQGGADAAAATSTPAGAGAGGVALAGLLMGGMASLGASNAMSKYSGVAGMSRNQLLRNVGREGFASMGLPAPMATGLNYLMGTESPFSKMFGNSRAGRMAGGGVGGAIGGAALGAGLGFAASAAGGLLGGAGVGAGFGATLGPAGMAIGALVGALVGILMGSARMKTTETISRKALAKVMGDLGIPLITAQGGATGQGLNMRRPGTAGGYQLPAWLAGYSSQNVQDITMGAGILFGQQQNFPKGFGRGKYTPNMVQNSILNAFTALKLASDTVYEQSKKIVQSVAGKDIDEALMKFQASSVKSGTLGSANYNLGIQSIIVAYTDLPKSIDAANIAQEAFTKDGLMDIEKLKRAISDVSGVFSGMGDYIKSLAKTGNLFEAGQSMGQSLMDGLYSRLSERIISQGVFGKLITQVGTLMSDAATALATGDKVTGTQKLREATTLAYQIQQQSVSTLAPIFATMQGFGAAFGIGVSPGINNQTGVGIPMMKSFATPTFAVVPGAAGSPAFGVLHGKETVRSPQGEDALLAEVKALRQAIEDSNVKPTMVRAGDNTFILKIGERELRAEIQRVQGGNSGFAVPQAGRGIR